jgi:hypothetical protein
VAADSKRNLIFVPQVAPVAVVGAGGDVTNVGMGICGSNSGCVGVYKSGGKKKGDNGEGEDDDHQGDDNHQGNEQ